MAFEARNLSLFGLDLARLGPTVRAGWAEALRWPMFAWLAVRRPVRVTLADGTIEVRQGATSRMLRQPASADCVAVIIPDDLVLIRRLELPSLSSDALEEALALEVQTSSPFGIEATAWGWHADPRADGGLTVRLAMAPRDAVQARCAEHGGADTCEAWVDAQAPIVLNGFGERRRARREAGQRAALLVAMALVLVTAGVLVVTPFLQMRQQVFDAQAQYAMVQRTSAEAVQARAHLQLARDQLLEIREGLDTRPDLPGLLETLAREIPDSAHLIRLSVRGDMVQVFGQGTGLSALVDRLGAHPEFERMRSPTPISRVGGTSQEQFSIEFAYRPRVTANAATPGASDG